MIPSSRSLLKAIDGFTKLINICGMVRAYKACQLSHKDIFREPVLKKGFVNVQLAERPTITYYNTKHKFHCGRLNNKTEGFMVIHTQQLMKAFGYKVSFKPVNGTIKTSFNTVNSLTAIQIRNAIRGNQFPSSIMNKCIILFGYSLALIKVFESL